MIFGRHTTRVLLLTPLLFALFLTPTLLVLLFPPVLMALQFVLLALLLLLGTLRLGSHHPVVKKDRPAESRHRMFCGNDETPPQ